MKQFIGSHSRKKSERATRANSIVAHATVHLKKNCRQISARWQTNLAQLCDAAKFCGDAARDSLLRIALFC